MSTSRRKFLKMAGISGVAAGLPGSSVLAYASEPQRSVPPTDWLIDGSSYKATLTPYDESGQLLFSNGLVSRTFATRPNGATIGFENLVNGDTVIRSIRPEAIVQLNGVSYEVGGLKGQSIHNYVKREWIGEMHADAAAFQYVSHKITDIQAPFSWKKRMEWLPGDRSWPPKGKTLTMTYGADERVVEAIIGDRESDRQRDVLMEDHFMTLSPDWQIETSSGPDRSLFLNEGKPGEMLVPSNTAVYAEMELPAGTRVVKSKISPGTDLSGSHGPGMAIVFSDKIVRLAFSSTYGLVFFDGDNRVNNRRDSYTPYFFRMEIVGNELIASISMDDSEYREIARADVTGQVPLRLRLGKTDAQGRNTAAENRGVRSRSQVEYVSVLGDFSAGGMADSADALSFLTSVQVHVHYSLFDGLPLLAKWVTVSNNSAQTVTLNRLESEILAAVEGRNLRNDADQWELPNLTIHTDYACGGTDAGKSYEWTTDPLYLTQIDYRRQNPCLLVVRCEFGPQERITAGKSFESYRVYELVNDSYDRERKGLGLRKMWRTVAPWITENPIMMHVRSADDDSVKKAIDQCADVGFQMVIMTFGSGFNMENPSEENVGRIKALSDYARSRGIALGGYSLLASRRISDEHDVVMPEGLRARFGNSPCLGSAWGQAYFQTLYRFFENTQCEILEHDGSYPGDICASTVHPGHEGLADSRWKQFVTIRDFYRWCRSHGIFLNIPDTYYLNGSNKAGMGYRETNWSLPRAEQEIIERQNVYDGTWEKPPSMGWMFVPLVQYHGGGAAATIEPLRENLDHYEQRLANLFGAGVQATYRGPQLYDAPETREVVKRWVDFYNRHIAILNADIIHVRRPDGRDYDAILHADPSLEEKGLLMVYNPLQEEIEREIRLNVYYTGINEVASVTDQFGNTASYELDRTWHIQLPVRIPARSQSWYILR